MLLVITAAHQTLSSPSRGMVYSRSTFAQSIVKKIKIFLCRSCDPRTGFLRDTTKQSYNVQQHENSFSETGKMDYRNVSDDGRFTLPTSAYIIKRRSYSAVKKLEQPFRSFTLATSFRFVPIFCHLKMLSRINKRSTDVSLVSSSLFLKMFYHIFDPHFCTVYIASSFKRTCTMMGHGSFCLNFRGFQSYR